jgi:hypothetical protein
MKFTWVRNFSEAHEYDDCGFLLERQLYLLILLWFLMAFRVPACNKLNIKLKISTLEMGCFSIKQMRIQTAQKNFRICIFIKFS